MSETIFESSDMGQDETTIKCLPSPFMGTTMTSNNTRLDVSDEDSNKLFDRIQKACDENKLNKLPVFDFIKLYEDRIVIMNQRVALMTSKLQELTKEITIEKKTSIGLETTMLKSTEMAKSLQRSNEL